MEMLEILGTVFKQSSIERAREGYKSAKKALCEKWRVENQDQEEKIEHGKLKTRIERVLGLADCNYSLPRQAGQCYSL